MNLNFLGLAGVILAIIAFLFAYKTAGKLSRVARLTGFGISIFLSSPALAFAAYYCHVLPEYGWFYEFRSWKGTELLVVFPGVTGGLAATFIPRSLLILPLLLSTTVSFIPFIKPFFPVPKFESFTDKWVGDICLQSSESTCGPASLASVFHVFGVKECEKSIAKSSHSYVGGTEAWYLARHARKLGFQARFLFRKSFDPDIPLPTLTGVRLDGFGHFIPILSRKEKRFRIGDPLIGEEWLTSEQLQARYTFTGFYLAISTNPIVAHPKF